MTVIIGAIFFYVTGTSLYVALFTIVPIVGFILCVDSYPIAISDVSFPSWKDHFIRWPAYCGNHSCWYGDRLYLFLPYTCRIGCCTMGDKTSHIDLLCTIAFLERGGKGTSKHHGGVVWLLHLFRNDVWSGNWFRNFLGLLVRRSVHLMIDHMRCLRPHIDVFWNTSFTRFIYIQHVISVFHVRRSHFLFRNRVTG